MMPIYYFQCCFLSGSLTSTCLPTTGWFASQDWPKDRELEKRLKAEISTELAELDGKLKDVEENAGESEVREAKLARAEFFARIMDKKRAEAAYEETFKVTVGFGQKIDIVLSLIRIGLTDMDYPLVAKNVARAKDLIDKGGDWERRNRLKVYEATFLASRRDIKAAAKLFLDALATFSATELYSFKKFVVYTVIMSLVSVDRPTLRDKVVEAPEILSVILEQPKIDAFMNALVNCNYKAFMQSLPDIIDIIEQDRFIAVHSNYIGRELRVVAYSQFLASYQSVTLAAMSTKFGVGLEFLDRELARFIAAGRLNCKIDAVGGVIETTRPDAKNALYQRTIKQGDVLLNRVQKLSRIIDV
jgi:26S proteasome regulatory subunit N7